MDVIDGSSDLQYSPSTEVMKLVKTYRKDTESTLKTDLVIFFCFP